MHNEQILQQLRQGVEEAIDTKMRTPKDFDTLSESIYQKTHKCVSSSTLKGFWGYLSSVSVPRLSTLNILSQFIGHADFESFCHNCEEEHLEQEPDNHPVVLPPMPSADDEHGVDRKSFLSIPKAWILYAIMALAVAGAVLWGLSYRQSKGMEDSPYILKKGQTFATYQDYLALFGIHAEDYLWGQRLPHHPSISIWGPQYHHPAWHNDGDSAQLLPTITEWWEPSDGSADSVFIATRNSDRYLTYLHMNELRITFMKGLTPDGDSLTFLGVYRLDLDHSNTHHLTWERVADAVDLNRLDYLEELRN